MLTCYVARDQIIKIHFEMKQFFNYHIVRIMMSVQILILFIVSFNGINAQQRLCPRCENPFDPTTCTHFQNCHDVCELQLFRGDRYTVTFTCGNSQTCVNYDASDCSSNHQSTCLYCCDDVNDCLNKLRQLEPVTHPTSSTSTTASKATTHASSTETSHFSHSTLPTTRASTTNHYSTLSTVTRLPTHGSTTHSAHRCVQCGDFASSTPCTSTELLVNKPTVCPDGLPYCFESINLNGGSVLAAKGCAEHNFCRVEWDLGHSGQGCYPMDVTGNKLSCTYCCHGNSCNTLSPPADNSLVTFQ